MKMKSQNNNYSLATALLKKVKGGAQPDYTIVSSGRISPLYNLAEEYRNKYPNRPVHSERLISEITDPVASLNNSSQIARDCS